jgi:ribonuclease P protein component
LVLSARPEPQTNEPPRLGIVASRRVGNAVARNRAKRLVREAFRTTRDLFDTGLDIVVIVTRSLSDKKLADVVGEWRDEAQRIRRKATEALHDREPDGSNGVPEV